jgi:uncharacterized protein YjlB
MEKYCDIPEITYKLKKKRNGTYKLKHAITSKDWCISWNGKYCNILEIT